jgi:hypothetical protein
MGGPRFVNLAHGYRPAAPPGAGGSCRLIASGRIGDPRTTGVNPRKR